MAASTATRQFDDDNNNKNRLSDIIAITKSDRGNEIELDPNTGYCMEDMVLHPI